MINISSKFEKVFSLLKNSIIPATIFAVAAIFFHVKSSFSVNFLLSLHYLTFVLAIISCFTLLYFNKNKPLFFIISTVFAYISLNYLKKSYGMDFPQTPSYQNLRTFLPLSLIVFYFMPNSKLLKRHNAYIILALFTVLSFIENLSQREIAIEFFYNSYPLISISLFLIMNISFFIKSSIDGQIISTSLFFASLCITLGFYYAEQASAISIFFFASLLISTISIAKSIYYSTYKDVLTDLNSRQSFIINSSKLPLKYSVGILAIDEYANLSKAFGKLAINALIKMIAIRITENENSSNIYRYSNDEFIIIFKDDDKNSAYNKMENLRRSVASAEFHLHRFKNPLKLTVSGSVSEKKRSDADAFEVLTRAHKALQKTYKFTQNVTTKA